MRPKCSAFQSYFEKFSASTVIRVFNFIRTAPSLVERTFWLVVFLCSASLTVWDVLQTIERFIAEPTASIVSYPVVANGFNFSNATWCLTLSRASLLQLYGNQTSVDEIVKIFSSKSSIVKHFEGKLNMINAKEDKLIQNFSTTAVNGSIADASLASYYSQSYSGERFSDREVALIGLTSVMLSVLVQTEVTKVEETLSPALRRIYNLYASQQTNVLDLIHLTAELYCVVQQVKLFTRRPDSSSSLVNISIINVCKRSDMMLEWFGPGFGDQKDRVCYRFAERASAFVFSGPQDDIRMTARAEELYLDPAFNESLPFDMVGLMNVQYQAPMLPYFGKKQQVYFSVETWSTTTNLRRSKCLARQDGRGNAVECSTRCKEELLRKACNCVPLISAFSGKPTLESLENCVGGLEDNKLYHGSQKCASALRASAKETNESCSFRCYKNCETVLFSNTISPDESYASATNASTMIRLRCLKLVYQNVLEYKTMEEMQLITSLGGNLSLYLGASFLALIHIFVFFVKLPFELVADCISPKVEKVASEEGATVSWPPARNIDEAFGVLFDELANVKRQVRRIDHRLDLFMKAYGRAVRFDELSRY